MNKLRTTGIHEQQLGIGRDRGIAGRMLDDFADRLANGRAAWFAKTGCLAACIGQSFGQSLYLCRFAAALDSLEGDE
ncbi:uncharacterized protein METZ01_LOCUS82412 [marine metagenome]|uniref:Uncharacterized protein n=1 Tax=marine metagenome TaxID=408172 RepID=A0A381UPI9_9ZZZZ